jgi:hypothetical protein
MWSNAEDCKLKYSRSVTLNHSFFKTQKHYINFCEKMVKTRNLVHPLLVERNFSLLAWFLSKHNLFKRKGVRCIASSFSWLITKEESESNIYFTLENTYKNVIEEIRQLKSGEIVLSKCLNIFDHFSILEEDELISSLEDASFSDEFFDFLSVLKNKSGLYFLYDSFMNLLYIGKSYKLDTRIPSSIKERKPIFVSVMITENESDANILEPYYIAKMCPSLNGDMSTIDKPLVEVTHSYSQTEPIQIYNLKYLVRRNKKMVERFKEGKEIIEKIKQVGKSTQTT